MNRSATCHASLPLPDDAAQAHSNRLLELISEQITQSGGKLPFDRFMELALYAPGLGYYSAGTHKFGEAGDFVTAPEISPLFARCLARQCQQVFGELGGGDLLEVGGGSGVLAADLLIELQQLQALPDHYWILELSPDLRQRQRDTLQRRAPQLLQRVGWLDQLPEPGLRGVVIANELLDALPVQRFRITSDGVEEQFVTMQEDQLASCWERPVSAGLEAAVAALRQRQPAIGEGYQSEINLRAGPWLEALAGRLVAGVMLLIDYGHEHAAYYHPERSQGTLMCHYRHRVHADPLCYPGLQDITAHVDFSALAEAAQRAGLTVAGYTTQALFLIGCGLEQLIAASDPQDVAAHMQMMQEVKQLTLPSEMGERFKVLGVARGVAGPLIGFSLRDLRDRL